MLHYLYGIEYFQCSIYYITMNDQIQQIADLEKKIENYVEQVRMYLLTLFTCIGLHLNFARPLSKMTPYQYVLMIKH